MKSHATATRGAVLLPVFCSELFCAPFFESSELKISELFREMLFFRQQKNHTLNEEQLANRQKTGEDGFVCLP